ncbi:MAG: GWxTD domain-containing protein [Candidatus Aminicenantales bacterium]
MLLSPASSGLAGGAYATLSGQTIKEKDLPPKYQEWLKLVSYIILQKEKDVFLQLTTDRDRDIFIESFWRQRDPTPGTPQNEFKEEHIKRFNYANTYYRRGTPREGWMTDMGRIYIILGPPSSDERFEGTAGIHPCQVWYYYGDRAKGLPTYFALVFFQRSGSGEFKLYNPTSDGPLSLLVDPKGIDITDYRTQYEKIRELAPTLANVAISMIPGQYPYNFQPSVQANFILADIFESPRKSISPSYATHFLDYKGIVSTEYLTNYIESAALAAVIREPLLDISFCHFSVAPKKISIDYFEPKDQYYCNFRLDVSLRQGERIIYQYSKDYPFYFEPDRLANVEANGVALQDVFPVVEGRYKLTVLLQNSVGREFTVYEKTIDVPASSATPKILGPVLGYNIQSFQSESQTPFKFLDKQLFVDPANTFTLTDNPAIFFNLTDLTEEAWRESLVEILISGLREKEPVKKSISIKTKEFPFHQVIGISQGIPIQELSPDYYELRLVLKGSRADTIAEASSQFIVSPQAALSRPVTLSKSFLLANLFLYYHILADQYDRINEAGKAEDDFERALALNPGYKQGIIAFADFLLKTGKFDRALEMVERVSGDESLRFDYFLVKGRALEGKGEWGAAIESLLEGNRIYNSDTRLLNSLGFCYYKTGQKKAALDALGASLRLNPEQKEIKELAARVEKELK